MEIVSQENFYVYELDYPNDVPFYYGKGSGDRIHDHEKEARLTPLNSPRKTAVIRKIWLDGEEVRKRIIAYFKSEQDAYMYEWALINMTCIAEHLTNGFKVEETRIARQYIQDNPLFVKPSVSPEGLRDDEQERQTYAAWRIHDVTALEKLVLIALADYASDNGCNVHPKIQMLANKTCQSERTVTRCLKVLEGKHYVCITRGTGKAHSDYVLTLPKTLLAEYDKKQQKKHQLPIAGTAHDKIIENHFDQLED